MIMISSLISKINDNDNNKKKKKEKKNVPSRSNNF